jgi:enoyl-CoA hydratase/carnithine racemase
MDFVRMRIDDGIAIMELDKQTINALNLQVLQELDAVLEEVRRKPHIRALVLTSANDRFFCIGFDLPELLPLEKKNFAFFLNAYNRLCLRLFTFPKPTITAITGHATAGGCILALCTDFRFMAAGNARLGVNEIGLGVPITYLAYCLLKELGGGRAGRDSMYEGTLYTPEEAQQIGLVDRVVPAPELISEAARTVRRLGNFSHDAFKADKRFRVQAIEADVLLRLDEEEEAFVEQWYAPAARTLLEATLPKFAPRE